MCCVQRSLQRLAHIHSATTTLQACIIILSLLQLAYIASGIPYFKVFVGMPCLVTPGVYCAAFQ